MEAKEKMEEMNNLNMHNEEIAESEEMKERFMNIFSAHNDYSMPLDIAWQTFKVIIKRLKEDITPDDIEKIASLCIDVKKEYYENVRGIITDNNGNPDIPANVKENSNFFYENPDIQAAAEMNLAKDEFKSIMDETEPDKFWESFMNLSEAEKDEFEEFFWNEIDSLYNNPDFQKEFEELVEKQKSGEELTAKDKEKAIKYQRDKEFIELQKEKKATGNKHYTPDEKLKILATFSSCTVSENPEEIKKLMTALRGVMSDDEIKLFSTNKGEFIKIYLGYVNSLTNGSYDSIAQLIEEAGKDLLERLFPGEKNLSQVQDKLFEEIAKNAESMKIERTNIQENLDSKLEVDIFEELGKIDLSKDGNPVMLLKLYKELEGTKKYGNEAAKERSESMKKVLKQMIFAPENAGVFGNYLDTVDGGYVTINENNLKTDSEKLKEEYAEVRNEAISFLHSRDKYQGLKLDAAFLKAESVALRKIDKKDFLNDYINKKKQLENVKDPSERMTLEVAVLEAERKMSMIKEFSTFYSNGRVDFKSAEEYYKYAYEGDIEHGADEKLDEVIVRFSDLEKTTNRDKIENMDSLKRAAFEEILPNGDYEHYREMADVYISDYCDRKAMETVYHSYINGKNVDNMKRMEAVSYIRALGYLYSSEIPEMKEFAENMIKQNFSSVALAEDGSVDREKFELLYNSYHSTEMGRTFENATAIYQKDIKNSISKSKKFDLSRSGMEFSDDLKRINASFRDSAYINSGAKTDFSEKEQEIVDKLKGSVNLEDIKDIETIVLIAASLEKREGKNEFSKEDRLLLNTIRKFATSSENRIYFEKYLGANDLKTSAEIKEFNPAIVEALGYDGELETYDVEKLKSEKYLESDDLGDTTTVLECVFSYSGDVKKLEAKLKNMQVLGHESTSIFRKDGKIDGEFDEKRLTDLISTIDKISELEADKKKLAETLAKSLRNSDIIEEFSEAFEAFIESADLVMKDITKEDKSISQEERELDANFRQKNRQEIEDATWQDVQEALRRMEEREPSKNGVDLNSPAIDGSERHSKIERVENGEFVTDEEFISVVENLDTGLSWERFQVILKSMEERNPSARFTDSNIDIQMSDEFLKRKMAESQEEINVEDTPLGDGELEEAGLEEEQIDLNGESKNGVVAENVQNGEELNENETINTPENNTDEVPLENVVTQAENIVSTNIDGSDKTQKTRFLETIKNRIIEILDKIRLGTSEEKETGKISLIKLIKDFFNRKNEQPKLEEGKGESNTKNEEPSFDEKYAYKIDEAKAIKDTEVQKAKAEQMMESGDPTQYEPSKS